MAATIEQPGATGWPSTAEAVIGRVVSQRRHLFHAYREFTRDDLHQEALAACLKAWPKFDPARGAWSTYLTRVATMALLMLYRARLKRARREMRVAVDTFGAGRVVSVTAALGEWIEAGESAGLPGGLGGDDETLDEWAGKLYRHAVHAFPRPDRRGGRKWFNPAQMIVATLVRRRRSLSIRGAVMFFADSPDLLAALQLRHPPSRDFFHRASFLTEKLKVGQAA